MPRIEVNRRAIRDRASEAPCYYDAGMGRLGSILLLGLAACAPSTLRTVPRSVDGQIENGPFVSPYAYKWFIEGEVSAAKGQHGEAAMAFETATTAPADDVLLMTRLAEEYELSGASRRADRALALARRYYPQSARVALAQGRIRESRGASGEALLSFARAEELAPTSDEPIVAMAEALISDGHAHRAKAMLLEYMQSAAGSWSHNARRLLLDLSRHTGDAETFERALALDPSSTAAESARAAGELALETGQPALAGRILTKALDTPENTILWLHALVESGDQEKAAAFLATADSKRLGGVVEHASLLLQIDEVDDALDLLEAADTSPRVEYAKGRVLLAHGDYIEAATLFARVPFGAASYEPARVALAACWKSRKRQGAAAETLSLAPYDSLAVREKLARVYLEEGALPAGLRLFDPKQPSEHAILAALFERAGHFEEASAYYATVNIVPGDEPRLQARVAAERLVSHGNRRGAIAILARWTAFAPDDLYARVRIVELLRADGRAEAARKQGRQTLEVIDDPLLRARLIDILGALADAAH